MKYMCLKISKEADFLFFLFVALSIIVDRLEQIDSEIEAKHGNC